MTGQGPQQGPPHSSPSNLGWPMATMVLGLLAAVTIIAVSGADVNGLIDVLKLILSAFAAAGGVGAWVNSTRAARNTNGDLEKRMEKSVHRGLASAIDAARRDRKGKAPAHAQRPSDA